MILRDLVALVRPRQWTKNLAVFAAVVFSGRLAEPHLLLRTLFAFVALCLVSGGLYAINDAVDVDRDRIHPVKCRRPVAAGRMGCRAAMAFGICLAILGMGIAASLGQAFLMASLLYFGLQILYVFWLKHVIIVDMLVIAIGFTIRAVAGAWVVDLPVSPWLILCTGLLALFLAAAKRRRELLLLVEESRAHRPVLNQYSAELLDSFMFTLSAATITAYALYTFYEVRDPGYSMMMTLPFVVYGVLRYQYLALHRNGGGQPEEVLLSDVPLLMTVVLWLGAAVAAIYVI